MRPTLNNDKINNMNENITLEMTRQLTKPLTYKPVSEERYQQLIVPLKAMGVTIMRGGEAVERHLDLHNAQASNLRLHNMEYHEKKLKKQKCNSNNIKKH